jgi:hypothetical protein
MKRMLLALAAVAMIVSATGCSLTYSVQTTTRDGVRREVGLFGCPLIGEKDMPIHGLLPVYIITEKSTER